MLLVACATAGDPPVNVDPVPQITPALAADIRTCYALELTAVPDRDLSVSEVERILKSDGKVFFAVKACLWRAICQNEDTRRQIAQVDEQTSKICEVPPAPPAERRKTKTLRKR
jgi:hypothetical protein